MSQLVEGLVKPGQFNTHTRTNGLLWGSTTIAGIPMGLVEPGATQLIRTIHGTTALFHNVTHTHTTVRKEIRLVSAIQEG